MTNNENLDFDKSDKCKINPSHLFCMQLKYISFYFKNLHILRLRVSTPRLQQPNNKNVFGLALPGNHMTLTAIL